MALEGRALRAKAPGNDQRRQPLDGDRHASRTNDTTLRCGDVGRAGGGVDGKPSAKRPATLAR
jgi:hypothetical protein